MKCKNLTHSWEFHQNILFFWKNNLLQSKCFSISGNRDLFLGGRCSINFLKVDLQVCKSSKDFGRPITNRLSISFISSQHIVFTQYIIYPELTEANFSQLTQFSRRTSPQHKELHHPLCHILPHWGKSNLNNFICLSYLHVQKRSTEIPSNWS